MSCCYVPFLYHFGVDLYGISMSFIREGKLKTVEASAFMGLRGVIWTYEIWAARYDA